MSRKFQLLIASLPQEPASRSVSVWPQYANHPVRSGRRAGQRREARPRPRLGSTAARLRNFIEVAARATLVGDVFDDAATGQGLLNYFVRGINCGAMSERETLALTGLSAEMIRSGSFTEILKIWKS